MSELADLYQEIILDHNKHPRNYRSMPGCTCHADGNNPLCGDEVEVFVQLEGDKLADVSFQGQGCAISRASPSLMTAKTIGRSAEEAKKMTAQVRNMLLGPELQPPAVLGDLAALSGVRKFPARIKCAMLPWHTLEAAIGGHATASTE